MAAESAPTMVHTAISSAMAGFIARVPCHPLDTIKARLQGAEGSRYAGLIDCARATVREEGILGLYRGFGAVAVLGPPAACLYFTGYEAIKRKLDAEGTLAAPLAHSIAGLGAEAFACILFVPVDVVKERLQVQRRSVAAATIPAADTAATSAASSTEGGVGGAARNGNVTRPAAAALPEYASSFHAFRLILRTEGLAALYMGYGATLASFGPFSALCFVFYEQARDFFAWSCGIPRDRLPAWATMCSSSVAGALAGVITNPIDLAKLRFQTQPRLQPGQIPPEGHLTGVVDAMRRVVAETGMVGLFRGAGARVAFHVPSTCISFTCFEECRNLVRKLI